jgi:hypothetical protein
VRAGATAARPVDSLPIDTSRILIGGFGDVKRFPASHRVAARRLARDDLAGAADRGGVDAVAFVADSVLVRFAW